MIFAKQGTTQKAAIYCMRSQVAAIVKKLDADYGKGWCLVDECKTGGEILVFNDGIEYLGFKAYEDADYRYSDAIKRFKLYQ